MYDVFYSGPKPGLFAFEKPAATIAEAQDQAKTKYFWYIDGNNDYTNFDFNYQPVPWEASYTHVWPSQWQQNGGTHLVPTDTAEHQWHWHGETDEITRRGTPQIFYLDFMNEGSAELLAKLKTAWPNSEFKSVRYVDSHLNVFKRIVNIAKTEYVWIISSVCDYSEFDFTWHHAQWQEDMIHVFPSGREKRGDTFYLRCDSFKQQAVSLELLDWFNVINYCSTQEVRRLPAPRHYFEHDNLVEEIKNYNFKFPYTVFTRLESHRTLVQIDKPWEYATPCLWSEKDRTVESLSNSNSVSIIPRDIKVHLRTQIYDYPYINSLKPLEEKPYYIDDLTDVIYISNGEKDEQKWYDHACDITGYEIKWIKGVDGRANAYQAAARASRTDWFFTIFAKLEVLPGVIRWQPDYFQEPKHYIFHAKNVLNGLEYGHMGVIAYNKRLVLETTQSGLDFTLSKAHAVIPETTAIAHFNADPWMTWRTAFREVVKLKHFSVVTPSIETDYRLKIWCSRAEGENAEWCLRGAADAVAYYDSVQGDYNKLLLTFEWAWLRQHAAQLGYGFF